MSTKLGQDHAIIGFGRTPYSNPQYDWQREQGRHTMIIYKKNGNIYKADIGYSSANTGKIASESDFLFIRWIQ